MLFDRLKEILADIFSTEPDSITAATEFDELMADELDFIELGWTLEEEFGISPRQSEAVAGFATVGELYMFLKSTQETH